MTVRVRPTSGPKRRRSSGDSEERFQLFVTVGFIGLIVAVVLILIGAVVYAYYDSHFRPIATVDPPPSPATNGQRGRTWSCCGSTTRRRASARRSPPASWTGPPVTR